MRSTRTRCTESSNLPRLSRVTLQDCHRLFFTVPLWGTQNPLFGWEKQLFVMWKLFGKTPTITRGSWLIDWFFVIDQYTVLERYLSMPQWTESWCYDIYSICSSPSLSRVSVFNVLIHWVCGSHSHPRRKDLSWVTSSFYKSFLFLYYV